MNKVPIFKIVVNEPTSRKSYQLEVDQDKAASLVGKKIGEEFDGSIIGLAGYTLEIRGGTDEDGFPMHMALKGQTRKKIILSGMPGFHPKHDGQRRRKMVCGDTVSPTIMQLNVKVVKAGAEPLEKLAPQKPKEAGAKKEEKPKEEAKVEKTVEKKEITEKKTEAVKTEEVKKEVKTGGG